MVDAPKKYPELSELSEEIARCGRCGFCQSVCPVYHVSSFEGSVARGRNMYAAELISGGLDLRRKDRSFFSECLLCRACVDMCFSSVKTDEIVLAGRRTQRRIGGMSPIHKYIFENLLPDHRRLGRLIRLASMGRDAGILKLARALRIFGWFGGTFERVEDFLKQVPGESLRERLVRRQARAKAPRRAAFFIGCGTNFAFPQVGEASVAVLERLGYEVLFAEHGCCGLPAYAHGALDASRLLAAKNIEAFSGLGDYLIVTDCSSCASFLKDYPRLLAKGNYAGKNFPLVEAFASRVRDITELLGEAGRVIQRKEGRRVAAGRRVSFHDPCHLSRHQKLGPIAREVLGALPGICFAEMKEADWCCGGAGAFAWEHPELSLRILERKIHNVRSSGADILATTCPSCLMQLRSGLINAEPEGPESGSGPTRQKSARPRPTDVIRSAGIPAVEVRHLVEIVWEILNSQ